MIDCANCRHCTSISIDSEAYKVKCTLFGGQKVSMDYEDTFNCVTFSEKKPIKEPEKENVMIVLKSGRDYFLLDKEIDGIETLKDRIFRNSNIRFGNFVVKSDEIAAFAYVGE